MVNKKSNSEKEIKTKVKSDSKKIPNKNSSDDESGKKQIRLLKSVIEDLINKQSVEIIDLLAGKKDVNEFIIAKNLDLTINQTRNILYKLSDFGLVSFNRKKDKRKGWYIYFWTLNSFQALDLLEENLNKKLNLLESNLKNRQDGRHYLCTTCSIELNEETALLNEFTCPECEEVYELSDDSDVVQELERKIAKLKRELELVVSEKSIEGEKVDKEKTRKIKKAEKKKADERAKARKKAKKIRDKEKAEAAKNEKPKKEKKTLKKEKKTLKKAKKKSKKVEKPKKKSKSVLKKFLKKS
jgi:transcription initiation factor TFIIE subunit alpha